MNVIEKLNKTLPTSAIYQWSRAAPHPQDQKTSMGQGFLEGNRLLSQHIVNKLPGSNVQLHLGLACYTHACNSMPHGPNQLQQVSSPDMAQLYSQHGNTI